MRAIETCRTVALGGQVFVCPDCQEIQRGAASVRAIQSLQVDLGKSANIKRMRRPIWLVIPLLRFWWIQELHWKRQRCCLAIPAWIRRWFTQHNPRVEWFGSSSSSIGRIDCRCGNALLYSIGMRSPAFTACSWYSSMVLLDTWHAHAAARLDNPASKCNRMTSRIFVIDNLPCGIPAPASSISKRQNTLSWNCQMFRSPDQSVRHASFKVCSLFYLICAVSAVLCNLRHLLLPLLLVQVLHSLN